MVVNLMLLSSCFGRNNLQNCKEINLLETLCKFGGSGRNLEGRRIKIFSLISGRSSHQQIKSPGLHDGCCCLCCCPQNNRCNWWMLWERKLCYGMGSMKVNVFGNRFCTLYQTFTMLSFLKRSQLLV